MPNSLRPRTETSLSKKRKDFDNELFEKIKHLPSAKLRELRSYLERLVSSDKETLAGQETEAIPVLNSLDRLLAGQSLEDHEKQILLENLRKFRFRDGIRELGVEGLHGRRVPRRPSLDDYDAGRRTFKEENE